MEKLNELVALAEKADAVANLMDGVNPHTILAVAEALRALEQEKEAADRYAERLNTLLDDRDATLSSYEAKLAELEKKRLDAEVKLYRQESILPEGLSRCTAELVLDFSKAIAEKLHQSERKYGWSDGWKESDWQEKCLADFHHHIGKGDPRDVAAYCAFMWHHEWPTRPAPVADLVPEGWKLVPVEPTEEMIAAGDQFMDGLSRLGDAYDAMLAAAPEVE